MWLWSPTRSRGCWSIASRLLGALRWEFRQLSPVISLEILLWLHSILRLLEMLANAVIHGAVFLVCVSHVLGYTLCLFVPFLPKANWGLEGTDWSIRGLHSSIYLANMYSGIKVAEMEKAPSLGVSSMVGRRGGAIHAVMCPNKHRTEGICPAPSSTGRRPVGNEGRCSRGFGRIKLCTMLCTL